MSMPPSQAAIKWMCSVLCLGCGQTSAVTFFEAMGAGATFFLGAYKHKRERLALHGHATANSCSRSPRRRLGCLKKQLAHHLDAPWIQP